MWHESLVCYKLLISAMWVYLDGTLSSARGLSDLNVLYLDGVLTVSMRVMQLAHVDCWMLGMRGCSL